MALNELLKADLHSHTRDDPQDGHLIGYSAEKLIDHAAKFGFKVLSITNHDKITYSPYLKEYAAVRGVLLLPGVELSVEGKHILLINYLGPLNFKEFRDLQRIKDQNVLIVAAHPFFPGGMTLKEKLLEHIDLFHAIEYCHFYRKHINFNKKVVQLSEKYHVPLIGTSDTHVLGQMNYTYSLIGASHANAEAIVSAVKKGNIRLITEPLPIKVMLKVLKLLALEMIS